MTPTKRESIFEMTAEILRLGQEREIAEEEGDSVEVERIDQALKAYLHENLPAKVDGIRGYVQSQINAAEVHAAEAEYHQWMAKRAKGNIERVKAMCLEVMQHFQVKLYQGRLHKITRCGNGGLKPLVIRQPELVPDAFVELTVKMPPASVEELMRLTKNGTFNGLWNCRTTERAICTEAVRATLERGEGVPGCELQERGEHVRFT